MKDKLWPTHPPWGGAAAHAGLVLATGTPSWLSPVPVFGPSLGGCAGTGLGAGEACSSASPTPLLDGTMRHGATPLPSTEVLVGDEDLFRDVIK